MLEIHLWMYCDVCPYVHVTWKYDLSSKVIGRSSHARIAVMWCGLKLTKLLTKAPKSETQSYSASLHSIITVNVRSLKNLDTTKPALSNNDLTSRKDLSHWPKRRNVFQVMRLASSAKADCCFGMLLEGTTVAPSLLPSSRTGLEASASLRTSFAPGVCRMASRGDHKWTRRGSLHTTLMYERELLERGESHRQSLHTYR